MHLSFGWSTEELGLQLLEDALETIWLAPGKTKTSLIGRWCASMPNHHPLKRPGAIIQEKTTLHRCLAVSQD